MQTRRVAMSAQEFVPGVQSHAVHVPARHVFIAAHGVDGVSVRQIAAKAGVNHALVHRYFGAKDDMVAAILLSVAVYRE